MTLFIRWLSLVSIAVLLLACAGPSMEAQWRNPKADMAALQGKSMWVTCEAREATLALICEDQLASQLAARGVKVLRGAPGAAEDAVAAARKAGAASALTMKLDTSLAPASSGASFGIGIGGGSWSGGHGGGSAGGVSGGLAMPIGGGSNTSLAGQSTLTQASDGQVLWSGTARASGSGATTQQIEGLAQTTLDALKQNGLF